MLDLAAQFTARLEGLREYKKPDQKHVDSEVILEDAF